MIVWNIKNIKTIENDCKNILKIYDNEFVTYQGGDSKCIKFWNINNYKYSYYQRN